MKIVHSWLNDLVPVGDDIDTIADCRHPLVQFRFEHAHALHHEETEQAEHDQHEHDHRQQPAWQAGFARSARIGCGAGRVFGPVRAHCGRHRCCGIRGRVCHVDSVEAYCEK